MADEGRVLGGFRVIQSIRCGVGSQGTLYKAVCVDGVLVPPNTVVALKVMPVQEESGERQKGLSARTDALVRLSHPNVVRYFGSFTERDSFKDLHVIVQELLIGETLKERLVRFPFGLDVDECIHIARSVLSAMVCLSEVGIVHRDIKPANIFLCDDGTVKLIDFEVAQIPEGEGISAPSTGAFMGSFNYMAPEFSSSAFRGDVQSDMFSMGVVLHEMLTGKLPYRVEGGGGDANFEYLSRWSSNGVSPIRISPKIRHLLSGATAMLSKALSPERAHRYGGFAELLNDLSAVCLKSIRNGGSTYQLLQFIGKGGFGEVFKARVKESGRYVAVKHLLKAEYAKRFEREAKIMSRLDNPYFVRFVDFFYAGGAEGKEAFLVMDFLDGMPGSSLRDAIKKAAGRGLSSDEVLRAFSRYAHGLSLMHSHGIYHRDIKPSNLYYPAGRPATAAIMDLGIARDVNGTVTTGLVPGTLDYMPPEVVASGSRGEGGMDIYALGLCLYEALTGKTAYPRLPVGSASYAKFFSRAREKTPPNLDAARQLLGGSMYALLKEMTEPDLSRRLKDARLLARRIDALLAPSVPSPVRPAPQTPVPEQTVSRPPVRQSVPEMPRMRPMPPRQSPPNAPRRSRTILKNLICVPVAFVALVALGSVLWRACGTSITREWAEYELDGVIELWHRNDAAAAEGLEARWVSRWNPIGYGWRRILPSDYDVLTNRLATSKAKIRSERAARELELARASERRICMERLSKCRRRDGGLDEKSFMAIDGWMLPDWLNGDREVELRLSGLDRCVFAAVKAKLAVEPVETRAARLKSASALLRNSWTKRLLSPEDVGKLEDAIDAVSTWCVVVVRNACSDLIRVEGKEVAIGGRRVVLFKDGRSDTRTVARDGYRPLNLPKGLDGKAFEVSDDMFEAIPVTVEIPFFEDGVVCRIGERVCSAKETITLKPGGYECVYSKKDFQDQRLPFTVHVKIEPVVPAPGNWRRTDEYNSRRKTIDEAREKLLSDPVPVSIPRLDPGVVCLIDGERRTWGVCHLKPGRHRYRYARDGFEMQEGSFEITPGDPVRLRSPGAWETPAEAAERRRAENVKAMQDALLAGCRKLWANEPVGDRQDRLETAGVKVAKALFDGVVTEEDAQPLLAEINRRKKWVVGIVKNGCSMPIAVGGRRVESGTTTTIVFENGIPDDWFAEANGYARKPLLRDFDGRTLAFDNLDFVPLIPKKR